jgi:putative flippase GtrA
MKRFLKFATVGASGVVVNQGLLWFFTEIVGLYYLFSAAIGIEISIITNFILNEKWTFRDRSKGKKGILRRGVKFNAVSVAGLVINISVLFAFTEYLGIHYLTSNLIGICATFLWNYFVNLGWTWKSEKISEKKSRTGTGLWKAKMVSVVIPTYNEKDNIQKLIPMIFQVFKKAEINAEVIVVDDNSPDRTWKAAEELAKEKKLPVRVVRRKGKLGLSSAVIEGFKAAKGDALGVMDADHSHPVDVLPDMVKGLERYDMTVGSRHVKGGDIENWTTKRKIISKVAITMAKPLTKLKDTTSGYFMVRRDVLEGPELNSRGFKICLEVAVKSGARIKEVPIVFKDRLHGESKLGSSVMWDYIVHLKDLYKHKIRKKIKE